MSDRSAAHCGRHAKYRCTFCERNHPNSYHDDIPELDRRIAELEGTIGLERIDTHHLKVENARLREALRDAWSGMRYIRETHGELYGVGFDRVDEKCKALLGGACAHQWQVVDAHSEDCTLCGASRLSVLGGEDE